MPLLRNGKWGSVEECERGLDEPPPAFDDAKPPKLPPGKTCRDCARRTACVSMGLTLATAKKCAFNPSKFEERK